MLSKGNKQKLESTTAKENSCNFKWWGGIKEVKLRKRVTRQAKPMWIRSFHHT